MVRMLLVGCALVLVSAGAVVAQSAGTSQTEQQVTAAEKTLTEAMYACNPEQMARLISDDALIIRAGGDIVDKKQYIDMVIRPCVLEFAQSEPRKIWILDPQTAMVTGDFQMRVRSKDPGAPPAPMGHQLYTRVYVRRNGAWSLLQMSQTTAVKR